MLRLSFPAVAAPRRALRGLAENRVQIQSDLDQHRVGVRRVTAHDPIQPLDRRGKELPDGALELRVFVVLLEVGQQQLEPETHVFDVVDEDAIERAAKTAGGARDLLLVHVFRIRGRC